MFSGDVVRTTEPCLSCPGCWSWQRGELVRGHVPSLGWKRTALRLVPLWQTSGLTFCTNWPESQERNPEKEKDWKLGPREVQSDLLTESLKLSLYLDTFWTVWYSMYSTKNHLFFYYFHEPWYIVMIFWSGALCLKENNAQYLAFSNVNTHDESSRWVKRKLLLKAIIRDELHLCIIVVKKWKSWYTTVLLFVLIPPINYRARYLFQSWNPSEHQCNRSTKQSFPQVFRYTWILVKKHSCYDVTYFCQSLSPNYNVFRLWRELLSLATNFNVRTCELSSIRKQAYFVSRNSQRDHFESDVSVAERKTGQQSRSLSAWISSPLLIWSTMSNTH